MSSESRLMLDEAWLPNGQSMPVLSPHARITRGPSAFVIETPDAIVEYGRSNADLAQRMISRCETPGRTVTELRNELGAPWKSLLEVMQPAVSSGALWDASGLICAHGVDEQLSEYYRFCDGWAKDVFAAPFWSLLLSGRASTRLVLGWCEQFYHRTVGADEHNELAVVHCDLPDVTAELQRHFSEECGHGEIFLEGLAASGVAREKVLSTPPLPSTRRLIDFMSELGRCDTLAYLGCYGVLHSPREGQTLSQVRSQFAMFARMYPSAAAVIRAVGAHAEIDVAASHDQIVLEGYLRRQGLMKPSEARRVLQSVSGTVRVFNGFFEGILDHYGVPADSIAYSDLVGHPAPL